MKKVKCSIMRGGTSKAVFFHAEDMPEDVNEWERFLLEVMGSPDAKQIDGLGGANSLTSKVAIINRSERADADVDYTFGQVSLTQALVDFKANCGNISSAVGPYAVDQGLVKVTEPVTKVRIYNTNTQKVIVSEVEVENGLSKVDGDFVNPGVPGTGSPIYLSFYRPEGSVTGKLLPTGNAVDTIQTSIGEIPISIIDAANPLVFVNAFSVGLTGKELPDEYTEDHLRLLEEIRSVAAELCGFCSKEDATRVSPAVPKMTIVSEPQDYTDRTGIERKREDIDIMIRMMSMQKPHQSLAITGAICTSAGVAVEGSVLSSILPPGQNRIRMAHPAGILETAINKVDGELEYVKVVRTARKIMDGYVYTRNHTRGKSDGEK